MKKSDRIQGILFYEQLPVRLKPTLPSPTVSSDVIVPISGKATRGLHRIKPHKQPVLIVAPDTNKDATYLLDRLRNNATEDK